MQASRLIRVFNAAGEFTLSLAELVDDERVYIPLREQNRIVDVLEAGELVELDDGTVLEPVGSASRPAPTATLPLAPRPTLN